MQLNIQTTSFSGPNESTDTKQKIAFISIFWKNEMATNKTQVQTKGKFLLSIPDILLYLSRESFPKTF